MSGLPQAAAYSDQGHDAVRGEFEVAFFARLVPKLLALAGGGALLDLGCGDGLGATLAGDRLERYTGIDLAEPDAAFPGDHVVHDLRSGLGPVGTAPFDVYLATFGFASHLDPGALTRLLRQIADHARPGAVVALEALGTRSLEWPRLWATRPGKERLTAYRMATDVRVHPWAPGELAARFAAAGIRPLAALDRTVQAGPKLGDGRYWPSLPPIRAVLGRMLAGDDSAVAELARPLPPLPAGPAARLHHQLAERRRRVVARHTGTPAELARGVWALEPRSAAGIGHGLVLVGRVTRPR